MSQIRFYGGVVLILLSSFGAQAAKVRLQLEGLDGQLEQNVRINLSTIEEDEVQPDGRFKARINDAIRKGLKALGYYEPVIHFDFQEKVPPARSVLKVTVEPGTPVKVSAVNIDIQGEALQDRDYQKLMSKAKKNVGKTLQHDRYDNIKQEISALAWRKGYFDADLTKSQLGVSKASHESVWDIEFNSGQRYRFGKVTFSGSQIREDYLQSLVPFEEGEAYNADKLAELNRRLAETEWFNSALVSPDFSFVGDNKVLPLQGVVTPRTRNRIETGVGYSTDVGPRLTGSWRKPWVNSRGHSIGSQISISAPEQILDMNYKMPLRENPLEEYYLLQAGLKREDLNDTRADSTSLNVARYWDISSGWHWAVNTRWSYDSFTQANQKKNTMLLYPGLSVRRTRQQGELMPFWGDTQNYSVDLSNELWGSDINFVVFQAQNVWIRSLAHKHRMIMRASFGWIETDNFSHVPPTLRFFAGGDRSIRGYKYKSLSPEDSNGKLLGASRLATGSLEYQYKVKGNWWGAAFIDGGEAVSSFKRQDLKTGVGLGVRWASPIGPVKFDIATPVGDKDHTGMQFYIGLGPEL